MEPSKSSSRSNRGGGSSSRRDLMDRSKSPSRSNRSFRRNLMERSNSPSSRRSSRHLSTEASTAKRHSHNSLEERALQILNDDIPIFPIKQQNAVHEQNSKKKKILIGIIVALFILLGIAAGVSWYLLTQSETAAKGEEEEAPSVSPIAPSNRPTTMAPSDSPTDSPTNLPQEFDPPSQGDCLNIKARQPVQGQEDMILTPFGLDFDVTVRPGTDASFWTAAFREAFFRKLVPELTGCNSRRRDLSENVHRQLNEFRYAIGNVNAKIELQMEKICEKSTSYSCYRFVVKMDLYLKGTLSEYQLITLVLGILNPSGATESLVERMGLPSTVFESVQAVFLGSTTESPSARPSMQPSVEPTKAPSSKPTRVPSSEPTIYLTLTPTKSPTKVPSAAPSQSPSKQPSSRPSFRPSRQPSKEPSLEPTL